MSQTPDKMPLEEQIVVLQSVLEVTRERLLQSTVANTELDGLLRIERAKNKELQSHSNSGKTRE